MYQKIVLAYDGSEAGQQALLNCKELSLASRQIVSAMLSKPSRIAMHIAQRMSSPNKSCRRSIE